MQQPGMQPSGLQQSGMPQAGMQQSGMQQNAAPNRSKGELSNLDLQIYSLLQADKIEEADAKIAEALNEARKAKKLDPTILYLYVLDFF